MSTPTRSSPGMTSSRPASRLCQDRKTDDHLEVSEHWSFYPLLNMAGSDVVDTNGKASLSNPTNVKVLQMLYDMIYKYKIAVPTPGRIPPQRTVLRLHERRRRRFDLDANVVHGPVHRLYARPQGEDFDPPHAHF